MWQLLTVRLLPQKRLPGVGKEGSGMFLLEESIVLARNGQFSLKGVLSQRGGRYFQPLTRPGGMILELQRVIPLTPPCLPMSGILPSKIVFSFDPSITKKVRPNPRY